MRREEFKNLVKKFEHNILIKRELIQCKTSQDLILLAKKYGYLITFEDLNYDKTATKLDFWFKKSKINPLNYKT